MNRIITMLRRDFIRATRDNILLYIILSPLALAAAAALLLPSVTTSELRGYVDPATHEALGAELRELGPVSVLGDEEAVRKKVLEDGNAYGLLADNGRYRLILEGDEGVSYENSIAERITGPLLAGGDTAEDDEGRRRAMIKGYVIVLILMTTMMLGGMTAGFLIVEERAQKTLATMSVSPVSIIDYMLSKSLMSFMIPLVMGVFVTLMTLGTDWSPAKYLLASAAGLPMGIMVSLLLGYFADSQITALAVVKLMMPALLTLPILSVFIPRNLGFLFWVFPNYWMFKTLESAFLGAMAQYSNILIPGALSLSTGLIALFAFMPAAARRFGLR